LLQTSRQTGTCRDQPQEADVDQHLRLVGRRLQARPRLQGQERGRARTQVARQSYQVEC